MNKRLTLALFLSIFYAGFAIAGGPSTFTELTEAPAIGDWVPITDVSDATQSANGTSKKVSVENFTKAVTADDVNCLAKDNTDAYTPTLGTHPATLQTVLDNIGPTSGDMLKADFATVSPNTVDSAFTAANLTGSQATEISDNSTHSGIVTGNPHNVTNSDVGLGNVTNDAQLTASQLQTTLTNDDTKVPSGGAVTDAIAAISGGSSTIANVKDPSFGAVGDGVTDDTAAIEAARDSLLLTGGILYFPGGNYLCDGFVIDNTGSDDAGPRISIMGDGKTTSTITISPTGNDGITINGGVGGLVTAHSHQFIRDLTIIRQTGDKYNDIGISLNNLAWISISDVIVKYFNVGVYGTNFLSSWFYACEFRENRGGMKMEYEGVTPFSHVNAINITSCEIGANTDYGGWFEDVNTMNISGGAVEANGLSRAGSASFGLFISNSGVQGTVGINMSGTHFENNAGTADVWINNTGQQSVHTFTGVTFARITSSPYTIDNVVTNNVFVEATDTVPLTANFNGCGFYGLNFYAPSATRMTVAKAGALSVINSFGSDFSSAIDKPVFDNDSSGGGIAATDVNDVYWTDGTTKVYEAISAISSQVNGDLSVIGNLGVSDGKTLSVGTAGDFSTLNVFGAVGAKTINTEGAITAGNGLGMSAGTATIAGPITGATTINASGTVTGGNFSTSGVIGANGSITGGSLATSGNINGGSLNIGAAGASITGTTATGGLSVSTAGLTQDGSGNIIMTKVLKAYGGFGGNTGGSGAAISTRQGNIMSFGFDDVNFYFYIDNVLKLTIPKN